MEMNGIYQEGIYRKSGATKQNKLLEEILNKDIECQKVRIKMLSILISLSQYISIKLFISSLAGRQVKSGTD